MVTTVDKDRIMESMLESLIVKVKYYEDVKTKDLANMYLGELEGMYNFFNDVAARGRFVDETSKINKEFTELYEATRQMLVEKFASGQLE